MAVDRVLVVSLSLRGGVGSVFFLGGGAGFLVVFPDKGGLPPPFFFFEEAVVPFPFFFPRKAFLNLDPSFGYKKSGGL